MDARFGEILSRVVAIYERALADSPAAREWLVGRGVRDANLLSRFRLGWSAGTLAGMARGEVLDRLKTLGLLDAEGRERFAGSVVLPAFDDQGAVAQLAAYAADGTLSWLFSEETPVFWNGAVLGHAREVTIAPDPLAALVLVAAGREETVAPAGPGKPLGRGARNLLTAHAPVVTLAPGAEHLRAELEALGIAIGRPIRESGGRVVAEDADGFTVEFPRRLRFIVQGLAQDSARHLRASIRCFRRPPEGATVSRPRVHLDTLDLYHARSRIGFAKTAACLLGEDPTLLEEHLATAVSLAEEFLREREKPAPAVLVSGGDREEALKLLRDPKLLDRVLADLAALGYVGEEVNKLIAYVAAVSRRMDDPLSILVLSRSAAGKTTLAEAIAGLAPPEDVKSFTRLTAQTLYYQKPDALAHKLLIVEEAEGVEDAAYALRILQSARRLSLSTAAGHGEARTREVKGPVSLFVTTTRIDLDEETAGRFLTLSVDESREQTRAILTAQRARESDAGDERERILRIHQNAQRLLEPRPVRNPFSAHLRFPDDRLSARRDHRKYLGLIRAVAFVHQHQRKSEDGAIMVALDDIAVANRLAHHALGQSTLDLSPPSRRLLVELREWLAARAAKENAAIGDVRFTRRELREATGWKRTQLGEHLRELVEMEYLLLRSSSGQGRRSQYALDWDGTGLDGERFYRGLVDLPELESRLPGACREASGKCEQTPKGRMKPAGGVSAKGGREKEERQPC